ncbi:MAG: ABC transporter ATP-binding protein [Nitrospirae bacterium]|nr:ABC transporter ATP-binding protein [Nitrospirota bacterium]
MTLPEPVLKLENVRKVYTEERVPVEAVRGVSLEVRPGEILGIMGPSGSGKTTLLSIMGCILRPTSGEMWIRGRNTARLPERKLPVVRREEIGFVFQSFNLFPALSALENVALALRIRGMAGREARAHAEEALTKVGLSDRLRFLPKDLSGGQKQRVSLARAIVARPPLILADEPTGSLDSENGRQVLALLRSLARENGSAVAIVTHDHRVSELVDRLFRMEDGRLAEQHANHEEVRPS